MRLRLVMTMDGVIFGFLLAAFVALALATPGSGPAGSVDPSFGQGGETIVQPNPRCANGCVEAMGSQAAALAVAPDGRIVLAGNSVRAGADGQRSWLVRLEPNGTLDRAFGVGGYAEGQNGLAMSRVTVNTSAALVLVTKSGGGRGFGLERFTTAGAVDTAFGTHGVRWLGGAIDAQVEAVFDNEGRIVVLGEAAHGGPALARFLPSGEPDPTFGHHGVARLDVLGNATPLRLATEPSGAIIVAAFGGGSTSPASSRVLLARLTSSGAPARSFGRRGVVEASRAFAGTVDAMAVAADHGIVLASSTLHRNGGHGTAELVVGRYTDTGPDSSFGVRGVTLRTLPVGPGAGLLIHGVTTDGSGNAVIVGEHRERSIDIPQGTWFVARYGLRGRDCSFGGGGLVEGMEGGATAVTTQTDGRIVIAGWGQGRPSGTGFMTARYIGGGKAIRCPEAVAGT